MLTGFYYSKHRTQLHLMVHKIQSTLSCLEIRSFQSKTQWVYFKDIPAFHFFKCLPSFGWFLSILCLSYTCTIIKWCTRNTNNRAGEWHGVVVLITACHSGDLVFKSRSRRNFPQLFFLIGLFISWTLKCINKVSEI